MRQRTIETSSSSDLCRPADARFAELVRTAVANAGFTAGMGGRPLSSAPHVRNELGRKVVPGAMRVAFVIESKKVPRFANVKPGPLINPRDTVDGQYGADCCFCSALLSSLSGAKVLTYDAYKAEHGVPSKTAPIPTGTIVVISYAQFLKEFGRLNADNKPLRGLLIKHYEAQCRTGWLALWDFVNANRGEVALCEPVPPDEYRVRKQSGRGRRCRRRRRRQRKFDGRLLHIVRCLQMHGTNDDAHGLDGDESDASSATSGDEEDETRQMHDVFTATIHLHSTLFDALTDGRIVAVIRRLLSTASLYPFARLLWFYPLTSTVM